MKVKWFCDRTIARSDGITAECWQIVTIVKRTLADLEIVLIRDDVYTSSDYRVVSLKLVCGPFPLTRWLSCVRECALSPPHPTQSCSLSPTGDCFGSRCIPKEICKWISRNGDDRDNLGESCDRPVTGNLSPVDWEKINTVHGGDAHIIMLPITSLLFQLFVANRSVSVTHIQLTFFFLQKHTITTTWILLKKSWLKMEIHVYFYKMPCLVQIDPSMKQ